MDYIIKRFGELKKECNEWLLSAKYLKDKHDYLLSVDAKVRSLASTIWKEEDYFIWWYMNVKNSALNNKTCYEYAKNNDSKEIIKILNYFIDQPFT